MSVLPLVCVFDTPKLMSYLAQDNNSQAYASIKESLPLLAWKITMAVVLSLNK